MLTIQNCVSEPNEKLVLSQMLVIDRLSECSDRSVRQMLPGRDWSLNRRVHGVIAAKSTGCTRFEAVIYETVAPDELGCLWTGVPVMIGGTRQSALYA